MEKIMVYQFKVWDVTAGDYISGESFSTEERIKSIGGVLLKETAMQVDKALVNADGVYRPIEE